jgi:homoserine dehydrogenase
MGMETTKIGLVGMGTVGTGVARLLLDQSDRLARHAGTRLELAEVVVKDLSRVRDIELPPGILSNDINRVTKNTEIHTAVLLVGGLEPARTYALQLLESGKHLVTANKALLAEHGPELFDRARELNRSIAFDASVGGGIPIITNICQCFTANQIKSLRGILNGTTNFIVSQMDEKNADYATALAEAQQLGYAEADPTMDVSGADAAQKLAILAHIAFGARVHWSEIPRVGIDTLDSADLRYARELGYRIKLIAEAKLRESGLEAHVTPTLVKLGRPLAEVRQAYNAISVVGNAVGDLFYHGQGAGQMPTASAVVADIIDTVSGRSQITFRNLELWSKRTMSLRLCDFKQLPGRYYLRFLVQDHPGVLAEITGVLGRHQISIASIIQHEPAMAIGQRLVPLVIMTHQAAEGATQKAVEEISQLRSVNSPAVKMRVLD